MKEVLFNSSLISKITYDPTKKELTIHFHNNYRSTYLNVPESVFNDAVKSESVGKFFHKEIKGKFDYKVALT